MNQPINEDDWDTEVILARIEGHVKSIRTMLYFFTVLAVISVVASVLNAIVNWGN